MNDKKIYILLPVYNRKIVTERFIKCLIQQTIKEYHLILIDDGSVDGTDEMVRSYLPGTIVIKGKGNWWWAGCLQQGINWLKKHNINHDDLVLIINDDVIIPPEFLREGCTFLENKKRTLLLAQSTDETTRKPVESGVVADLEIQKFEIAPKGAVINCLSTRGLLLRFSAVLEVGGFYPKILPHYGSDYEYTIRAYNKGFHLRTTPSFFLEIDRDATGLHSLPDVSVIEFIKNIFSKRFVGNPIYRSTFISLTSSKKRIPILLYNVWKSTFRRIFHKIKSVLLCILVNIKNNMIRYKF